MTYTDVYIYTHTHTNRKQPETTHMLKLSEKEFRIINVLKDLKKKMYIMYE